MRAQPIRDLPYDIFATVVFAAERSAAWPAPRAFSLPAAPPLGYPEATGEVAERLKAAVC